MTRSFYLAMAPAPSLSRLATFCIHRGSALELIYAGQVGLVRAHP